MKMLQINRLNTGGMAVCQDIEKLFFGFN